VSHDYKRQNIKYDNNNNNNNNNDNDNKNKNKIFKSSIIIHVFRLWSVSVPMLFPFLTSFVSHIGNIQGKNLKYAKKKCRSS
jgi:hypothetical protein